MLKTRAIYLINPHNPTGTINDDEAFKGFLRESSQSAVVVVDEAYLEYTSDFDTRSAVSLVREGEGLGRLNLVGASAALADTAHVESTRIDTANERALWLSVLRQLKLPHTDTHTNFVFFDTGQPRPVLAAARRERGIDIGRAHATYTNWARITIGLPPENLRAQNALRASLKES